LAQVQDADLVLQMVRPLIDQLRVLVGERVAEPDLKSATGQLNCDAARETGGSPGWIMSRDWASRIEAGTPKLLEPSELRSNGDQDESDE
jgi:hypothetical protein